MPPAKSNIFLNVIGLFRPLFTLLHIPYKVGLNAKITGLVVLETFSLARIL